VALRMPMADTRAETGDHSRLAAVLNATTITAVE
jgi:hypothetical protein